ncbi:MAG: NAD(P)-dependent alcohol dehydrogenase [Proteobacteria bacterium]|nr:NAD(P)-dependent alcohol dehydrogenase [Pseudomonadota bacterium]
MQAMVRRCYGAADVVHAERLPRPVAGPGQVLVKVQAASVNPLDWHYVHGTPYLMRADAGFGAPEDPQLGTDYAGTVVAVGPGVQRFHPGDEVFGARNGSFAEYVVVREDRTILAKPANVSFAEAAAVPVAALTALQALRDKGQVHPGDKVLINGASGGVGTFAVQLARHLGADVTGVCSGRSAALVAGLGADHVIDYTREDFTRGTQRYDVIFDAVGSHPLLEYRRVLRPHGRVVIVGGPSTGNWLGPLAAPLEAIVISPFLSQKFLPFLAEFNAPDMQYLQALMAQGQLRPVIDRHYGLAQVPEALRYLEQGHAHGKVIIDIPGP